MNSEELKVFLSSIRETDIEELRFEAGSSTVFFRKSETPHIAPVPSKAAAKPAETDRFVPFKSPMVGTFYHSESSDHPPFVIEGNHIVPGQKIGIIEAMKIIKDVSSNVKGRIARVSVKNGQSVEYGQELFLVDPEDSKETQESK
ncbi:MAG: acetyl-CoA carboxylase biotin carboxyl carrier protein [Endomicrobiales bacterium]